METTNTIALVTGANRGIGLEIARGLARRSATTVLVAAREEAAAEETATLLHGEGLQDVHAIQLDVTDAGSIGRACRIMTRRFERLDVLVNNAGIHLDYAEPSMLSLDVVRQTYETNVFGVISTMQIFLPIMRKSAAPRIVNVGSGLGSLTLRTEPDSMVKSFNALAYCSSKTALNGVTVAFANELESEGFKINIADPGYTATNLNEFSGPRTPAQGATIAIELATLGDDGPTGGYFNDAGAVPW